jgi:hypothetical protein
MKEKNYTGLIPVNVSGKEINTEVSVDCSSAEEARSYYRHVAKKLLDVNQWHQVAGALSARFQLVDADGREVAREVKEGDYFKIDILGPGSKAGDGFDWVHVEAMKGMSKPNVESIGFRVRPCSNPHNKKAEVAHFYSNESTSTFLVTRNNNTIIAGIYDRNTKPNRETESLTDQIRHTAVGIGALSSFSKVQWESLAKGLVTEHK